MPCANIALAYICPTLTGSSFPDCAIEICWCSLLTEGLPTDSLYSRSETSPETSPFLSLSMTTRELYLLWKDTDTVEWSERESGWRPNLCSAALSWHQL